ncbi:TCP-1/cpn60 chaperonin family protein [Streptomyces sp. Ncost-T10-10d]|nr:TCP-1/cpn60 chaperonin family protein [Streptomyces sp. Ncost-T10-10d]
MPGVRARSGAGRTALRHSGASHRRPEAQWECCGTGHGRTPSAALVVGRSTAAEIGFNATTGRFGDLVEMGIVDPALVVRTALKTAASCTREILTLPADSA